MVHLTLCHVLHSPTNAFLAGTGLTRAVGARVDRIYTWLCSDSSPVPKCSLISVDWIDDNGTPAISRWDPCPCATVPLWDCAPVGLCPCLWDRAPAGPCPFGTLPVSCGGRGCDVPQRRESCAAGRQNRHTRLARRALRASAHRAPSFRLAAGPPEPPRGLTMGYLHALS